MGERGRILAPPPDRPAMRDGPRLGSGGDIWVAHNLWGKIAQKGAKRSTEGRQQDYGTTGPEDQRAGWLPTSTFQHLPGPTSTYRAPSGTGDAGLEWEHI